MAVNSARADSAALASPYADSVLSDIWARFEAPDARNRWDSPLVRVALACRAARLKDARLADVARTGQLPCFNAPFVRESGGEALAWWEAASRAQSDESQERTGPFITSRFDLSRVVSADALVKERGAGSVVEATLGAARKAARQVADATAGYGELPHAARVMRYGTVPLNGFSGRGKVADTSSPDYYAEDFNADVDSDAEDAAATDIADLNDFNFSEECTDDFIEAPRHIEPPKLTSSFKRATPKVQVRVGEGISAAEPVEAALQSPAEAPLASRDASDGDSIGEALRWLIAFCLGNQTIATQRGLRAEAISDGAFFSSALIDAPQRNDDTHLSADITSSAFVNALGGVDLSVPGISSVFVDGEANISFRIPRATTGAEIARLRRQFLLPDTDVGDGSAKAFAAFLTRQLKRERV
jgi:hypothetical protein